MGKRKACLIINPRSGQNITQLADILAVLDAADYKTTVALKEYGDHTIELAQTAAREGFDLIIAYGGDGTLNQVVNGVMDAKNARSTVGVIPGGTANLWANEIGVPIGNPAKAALSLLDSEVRHIDVGRVLIEGVSLSPQNSQTENSHRTAEGHTGSKKKIKKARRAHFLLMAGLGLDAVVMQGVSKPLKHKIRQLAVGLSAARELPAYRPFHLEVRDSNDELLWQGEAIQVVVGNTRLYADIFQITPEAYIDDGQLDICVITAGNPLGTVQQVFSLLLHHQPDELTAEYFRGAQLSLRVPASIGLQLDGSSVKLKDYLTRAQKQSLKTGGVAEKMLLHYRFEALPQVLPIAIPHTYNHTLFETSEEKQPLGQEEKSPSPATNPTEKTEQIEKNDTSQTPSDHPKEKPARQEIPTKLREEGRKVHFIGGGHDRYNDTYILAGSVTKSVTGTVKPMAISIDKQSTIFNQKGETLTLDTLTTLKEGREILVTGKKDKRGVIKAEYVLI